MLLTLAPPTEDKYAIPHAIAGYASFSDPKSPASFDGPAWSSPRIRFRNPTMTTPHRGLPLPGPMALSGEPRGSQPLPPPQPVQYAPLPSQHAHAHAHPPQEDRPGQDWYFVSKTEEDKRKQAEEATRQEQLRLEQRKVECDMLRHAIEAGVPPHLLPFIFVAIGGGMGSGANSEMFQQYMARFVPPPQQSQPMPVQAAHADSGLRRETWTIAQTYPPPHQQHPQVPGQPPPPHAPNATVAYPSPAYASPANTTMLQGPNGYLTVQQKTSAISSLPRLSTNEAQILNPPAAPSFLSASDARASPSPSIYFHHWQPPSNQPSVPGSKDTTKTSPNQTSQPSFNKTSPNQPSQPSSTEMHNDSPRKRKATGPHQPAPVPSTAPGRGTSPAVSERSVVTGSQRGGHGRQTSDQQRRAYDPVGRSNRQVSRRDSSQDDRISRRDSPPERRISQESSRPQKSEGTKSEANT